MAKSPPTHRWRIVYSDRMKLIIGYAEAQDEDTAIEQAIEKYNIDSSWVGKLIAEKTKGQPQRKL
jgi:hypothetical protein